MATSIVGNEKTQNWLLRGDNFHNMLHLWPGCDMLGKHILRVFKVCEYFLDDKVTIRCWWSNGVNRPKICNHASNHVRHDVAQTDGGISWICIMTREQPSPAKRHCVQGQGALCIKLWHLTTRFCTQMLASVLHPLDQSFPRPSRLVWLEFVP